MEAILHLVQCDEGPIRKADDVEELLGPANSNITLGSGTLTVNTAVAAQFDGNISGSSGSLTKSGVGTLTLNGDLTHTGNTTINTNGGTLQVNGSLGSGNFANIPTGATLGVGASGSVARSVTVTGGTVNLAGTMPTGTTLTLTTGTVNSTGTGGTAAIVNLPVQGTTPVLNAPAGQELTITNKLSQNNGGTVVTAGTVPFKVGGSNVVNTIGSLILQGGTTTIALSSGGLVAGLDIPRLDGSARQCRRDIIRLQPCQSRRLVHQQHLCEHHWLCHRSHSL